MLVAAYDDKAGVTAEFDKNVLTVVNRELGADFDPDAFTHVALWDAENEWIEMRLRARREQTVKIPALDLAVHFAEARNCARRCRRSSARTVYGVNWPRPVWPWRTGGRTRARFALSLSMAR